MVYFGIAPTKKNPQSESIDFTADFFFMLRIKVNSPVFIRPKAQIPRPKFQEAIPEFFETGLLILEILVEVFWVLEFGIWDLGLKNV